MVASLAEGVLDSILAVQLTVAWAGEGRCAPKRLGWWDTDLIDPAGGGDFFARLMPRTHAWAALEAAHEAARLEAVPALERGAKVNATRREAPMIDKLHALLATVNEGRSIDKLMKEWRGKWDLVVDALTWLAKVDANVKELANLTIRQIGTLGPDKGPQAITEQLDMFAAK